MTSRAKKYSQYFTPPDLASKLIQAITVSKPSHVGDFAAGEGELLRAAEKRWPKINCTAVDIDEEVTTKLQISHPDWHTKCFDFTEAELRNKELGSKKLSGKFSAIVLNPPFSILGGVRLRTISIAGIYTRCSPALAFVVEALGYLKKKGQLVAIVPHSVTQSEKDNATLQLLIEHYNFEIVETISNTNFRGCSPRIAIIRLTNDATKLITNAVSKISLPKKEVPVKIDIFRGSISNTRVVSSEHQDGLPFIHTVDLSKGLLHKPRKRIFQENLVRISGPAVLIPRVGKPDNKKIVLLPQGAKVAISDCIIALLCKSEEDSELVHSALLRNWLSLEMFYSGTCARFISVKGLSIFLHSLGFEIALYELGVSSQNSAIVQFIQQMQAESIQKNRALTET